MTDDSVIDQSALAALLETTGDDPDFVKELIDTYLTDAFELLQTVETATSSGNLDELCRAAHSLKSNSATFGATTLSTLAQNLEKLGKSDDVEKVNPLLSEARAEFVRVEKSLREARESL